MVALAPLPVQGRGARATITKSILQIEDPDNAADGLVMVLEAPRHGHLARLHSSRALGRFKLTELTREQIQYVHNGSEGAEDAALLQVNDGHSYRNVLLHVHIQQKVLLINHICKIRPQTDELSHHANANNPDYSDNSVGHFSFGLDADVVLRGFFYLLFWKIQ